MRPVISQPRPFVAGEQVQIAADPRRPSAPQILPQNGPAERGFQEQRAAAPGCLPRNRAVPPPLFGVEQVGPRLLDAIGIVYNDL
jgi:hypothetical protein